MDSRLWRWSHDTKTAQWNGRVRVTKEVSQDTVVANIIVFFFCHGRFTLVVVGGGGGMERTKGGGGTRYATRGADETAEHQKSNFLQQQNLWFRRSLRETLAPFTPSRDLEKPEITGTVVVSMSNF